MQKNCKKFWFYQKTVVSLWRRSNVKLNLYAMFVAFGVLRKRQTFLKLRYRCETVL